MNVHEQIFLLEGHPFNKEGLLSFCAEKIPLPDIPDWEREIWKFFMEWFDPEEYIEVMTSGSTGKPKIIKLSKKHIRASAQLTLDFFDLKHGDTALLCLPVKYIAGKMMIVRALTGRLNLFFTEPSLTPDLNKFQSMRFAAMVPLQVAGITDSGNGLLKLEKTDTLIIGGSFLDKSLEEKLKTAGNNIWQTYGMTETLSHIALRRLNGPEASDWYSPMPGIELKKDKQGCLVITAPHIGVQDLVTNDLVAFDDKGFFKITGRLDNVIISGGVKLFPEEIEQKLSGLVEKEFFMAGIPDEKLGEKLALFIEKDAVEQSVENALWQQVKNSLSGYEVPKKIIFLKTFEHNNQGKIRRKMTVDNFLTNPH